MMAGFHYMAYPFKVYDKLTYSNEEAEQGLTIFFHKLLTVESSNIQNLLLHFIFHSMNMPIKAQEIEMLLPERFGFKDERSFFNKHVYSYVVEKYKLKKLKNTDLVFKRFDEDVEKMVGLHKLVADRYNKEFQIRKKAYDVRKEIEEFVDIQEEMMDNLIDSYDSDADILRAQRGEISL